MPDKQDRLVCIIKQQLASDHQLSGRAHRRPALTSGMKDDIPR